MTQRVTTHLVKQVALKWTCKGCGWWSIHATEPCTECGGRVWLATYKHTGPRLVTVDEPRFMPPAK